MAIKSENFAAIIFLLELQTQCTLFNNSISYLEKAVQRQTDRKNGIYKDEKFPPIEIKAHCTVCLSSLSSIRKILTPCSRKKSFIQKRCKSLMALLGNPALEYIFSPNIRNSWEHIDERLDTYLQDMGNSTISPFNIGTSESDHETLVLKGFNTSDLSIRFVNETINLKECISEINILVGCIDLALLRLQTETHLIYSDNR